MYLNEWKHGSPALVSNLGRLDLVLALQYHKNSL